MIPLSEIIRQVDTDALTPVAGQSGTGRNVRWFHMVESTEIASFLEGNELVFTTGAGLEKGELSRFVKAVYLKDAAGLIINLGPYISSVPTEVLDFCNSYGFPLFTCPWEVHMAQIMRSISLLLAAEEQETNAQEQLYTAIIHQGSFASVSKEIKQQSPLGEDTSTVIALLDSPAYTIGLQHSQTVRPCIVSLRRKTMLVFSGTKYADIQAYIQKMDETLPQGHLLVLSEQARLKDFYFLFSRTKRYFEFLQNKKRSGMHFYGDLGLAGLLFSVEDEEYLNRFADKLLRPLKKEKKGDELLDILSDYLQNNNSLKAVSEKRGLHKNTVTNHVHQATELLGLDLDSEEDRLRLEIALFWKNMHTRGK